MLVESGDPARVELAPPPDIRRHGRFDSHAFTPMEDHLVARVRVPHTGPSLENRTRALVSEQMRKKFILALSAVNFAELRAADAATVDLDEDLARIELFGQRDLLHHERLVQLHEDRSSCGLGSGHLKA